MSAARIPQDLKVQEIFHRVNHDIMELTVTITDPKYYTKPWNALDEYSMRLQSNSFDIREMVCSESEAETYMKEIAEEAAELPQPRRRTTKSSERDCRKTQRRGVRSAAAYPNKSHIGSSISRSAGKDRLQNGVRIARGHLELATVHCRCRICLIFSIFAFSIASLMPCSYPLRD